MLINCLVHIFTVQWMNNMVDLKFVTWNMFVVFESKQGKEFWRPPFIWSTKVPIPDPGIRAFQNQLMKFIFKLKLLLILYLSWNIYMRANSPYWGAILCPFNDHSILHARPNRFYVDTAPWLREVSPLLRKHEHRIAPGAMRGRLEILVFAMIQENLVIHGLHTRTYFWTLGLSILRYWVYANPNNQPWSFLEAGDGWN